MRRYGDQDAYGQEVHDYYMGKGGYEVIERDDGLFDVSGGPGVYFHEYTDWPVHEKEAIRRVRGRVLDIGVGAGRVALYLQEKGHDVVGIDTSPLALEVCRKRGVKKTKLTSITQVNRSLGEFDTIVMFGNNFGLFGSYERAKRLLKKLHKITSPQARIIAETIEPYQTEEKVHRDYHELNKARGRMPGQLRIRVRYRKAVSKWFDYLFVSKPEMEDILMNTGWRVETYIDSQDCRYIAVIAKDVQN